MSRRHSESEGEIVENSIEHKAHSNAHFTPNTNVDYSFRRQSVSQSPRPSRAGSEQDRSRSRSPYRHPSPRGEKRRRDDRPYRDFDRADNRRFKVHYEEGSDHAQANGRKQVSYADIDHGDAANLRGGGRDNYRDYIPRARSRSPGRSNRRGGGGRGRSERRGRNDRYDRSDRPDKHGRYDKQDNLRKNNLQGRSGYTNGQNGASHQNSREPSVSNRDDPQTLAQKSWVSAENRQREPQQETTYSTSTKDPKAADETSGTAKPNQDDMDFEPVIIDEDAIIAERRRKREAIKAAALKRQEAPLLQQALLGNASGPVSPAASTPADRSDRSASPATPGFGTPAEANVTDSPAVVIVNEEGTSAQQQEEYHPISGGDTQTAANYDPTYDQENDRLREEQRMHEQDVAKSDQQAMNDGKTARAGKKSKRDFDMFADSDEDDDMFAADTPTNVRSSSPGVSMPQQLDESLLNNWDDASGYYIIRPGELLDGRYHVMGQLGKGMFSEVVRATDVDTKEIVAIKIIRNNDTMRKAGYKEIEALQKVNENDPADKKHFVRFKRHFDHKRHLCLVFENLAMSVRDVLRKFGQSGVTLEAVKAFAYQIFVGLDYLRKQNIIHADFKPDNLLVDSTHKHLKICDLGSACELHETHELTPYLVSRYYRAPEIILGMPYDYSIDVWSVGCTLFELWTGKICFRGDTNNQMIRAMMEVRGKFSLKLLKKGEYSGKHFNDDGSFTSVEPSPFGKPTVKRINFNKPIRDVRTRVLESCKGLTNPPTSKEIGLFVDLIEHCLNLNPEKRITAADALKHGWFEKRRA